MSMNWTDVSSSAISAVGHDLETLDLTVRFTRGTEYTYPGVPAEVVAAMLAAPSVGKAFVTLIKAAGYGAPVPAHR